MAKRTGNIQDRGSSFRIRYYDANGMRQQESFKTLAEAQRELAIRLGELAKGIPVSSKPNTVLFAELADDVLTDYEVQGFKSVATQECRYRLHLLPAFGNRRACQITTAQIRKYILQRKSEDAPAGTINRELELIRHTFHMAIKGMKLFVEPHVPMLRENNVRTGFFTRAEVERLASFLPEPLASMVWFGFLTGWRSGEIQSLRWSAVDFARGDIRLDPGSTKNGKGRIFPMTPELRKLLKAREEAKPQKIEPRVFPIGSFRKAWRTACYKAGIPCTVIPVKRGGKRGAVKILACSRTFHDLRRSAIREWIRNGMPEKTAMMLSGHLTRSVLDRYNIVTESDLLEAVRFMGNGAESGANLHQKRD